MDLKGHTDYTLPIATTSELGGIKPDGTTIIVNSETGIASSNGNGIQGTTTGTASNLILVKDGFTLEDGIQVKIKLHVDIADGATLNVNNTGAKPITTSKLTPIKAGAKAASWLSLIYSSDVANFILQGEGGDDNSSGGSNRTGSGVDVISTYEWMLFGKFNPYYTR